MLLGDGHLLRGPVHLARRGVHKALHVRIPAGVEHVQRPGHVRRHVRLRRDVRVRDRDERGEMEDGVASRDGSRDGRSVAEVTGEELDLR